MRVSLLLAAAALCAAVPAFAQDEGEGAEEEASKTDLEWMNWEPDPATIEMPELVFEPSADDIDNYKKYYFFNRENTSFAEALADLRYCDGMARGLATGNYYPDTTAAMVQYGVAAGAIGGLVGGAIASAIYGSAEERRKRRVNMRRCMNFKGYERYGIAKDLWEKFNFEEGNTSVPEQERQMYLAQQAKVASGPKPGASGIGL